MRVTNFCNGLCILGTGIGGLFTLLNFDFGFVFASCYTILFGCLLCMFELRFGKTDQLSRKYCGFMYSFWGRLGFIFFAATTCLGLITSQTQWFSIVAGVLTLLNGLFNLFILCLHPGFGKGGVNRWGDPTSSYTDGGKEIGNAASAAASTYIKNNPDVARKAAAGAVDMAASNPQATAQALQAVNNQADVSRGRGSGCQRRGCST